MKLRHVRAIAVCGVAIVALTGARSSGGGGCDDSGSSSSSGSHRDSDDDYDTDATSGGGSTGGTSVGSGSGSSALRDVDIKECGFDATGKNMTATLTVENSSALTDYSYDITVEFKEASATVAGTATVNDFAVAAGETGETEATTPYTGTGDGSEVTRCEVRTASRSSL